MFLLYLSILHLTRSQDLISPVIFFDCKRLILPPLCQCYHSGDESQLRCHNSRLNSLPKLTNDMRWNALDFSLNNLTLVGSHQFSDIYVEKIDLKLNSIQTIDITAFEGIQNLKELFINYNQLKEFDPKILISLSISLEFFDISYNPLGYLDLGGIFLQLPYLKEFHVVSCKLNDSSLHTLLKLNNHNHYSLELIDLSYNNLTSLCNHLFDSFYKLNELHLNNNNIYAIDNYFIDSLNYLKILNLAFNSIEYVPNIFSHSLENLNLSSNNIRYLNDYFASNLRAIRLIDFDSNKYLNSISSRSFCFINILTLEKLSFRWSNISSINTFSELLCSLLEKTNNNQNIINLNNNINLKCDCMLIEFEKYLIDYIDLTCTQQGQDRYFISTIKNTFSNCTWNFCLKEKKKNLCEWSNSKQLIFEGTCQDKLIENDNSTNNQSELIQTTMDFKLGENFTENSTLFNETRVKSFAISFKKVDYIWFFIVYLTFHRF